MCGHTISGEMLAPADVHAYPVDMYLRTTQRRNKDGSVVRYLALAENRRHPEKGHVEARVIHSFGREDQLDRAALERLVASIRRVLGHAGDPGRDTRQAASAGSGSSIVIENVTTVTRSSVGTA